MDWSRQRIIAAVRDWSEAVGQPPRSYQWSPATARSLGLVDDFVRRWEREWPRWPGADTVRRYFGGWSRGLTAAGFPRRPPPELTVRERVETAGRMRTAGETTQAIAGHLGVHATTVRSYLRAGSCPGCGEPVIRSQRCLRCALERSRPAWTRHEILAAIRAWAHETGRPPSSTDWNAPRGQESKWRRERARWPGGRLVSARFGSWDAAIVAAGFEPLQHHYTREDIVAELRRDALRRGRPPRQKEWVRPTSEGFDIGAVARTFGGWGAGLRAAGLEPGRRRWENGEVVEALRAWAARQGRPPLSSDWRRAASDHPTAALVVGRFDPGGRRSRPPSLPPRAWNGHASGSWRRSERTSIARATRPLALTGAVRSTTRSPRPTW